MVSPIVKPKTLRCIQLIAIILKGMSIVFKFDKHIELYLSGLGVLPGTLCWPPRVCKPRMLIGLEIKSAGPIALMMTEGSPHLVYECFAIQDQKIKLAQDKICQV